MNNSLYPDAIEANHAGRFSWAQAGGLVGRIRFGSFCLLMGFLLIPFNPFPAPFLAWGLGYIYAGNIMIDLVRGSVVQVEGKGKRDFSRFGTTISFYYQVDGVRLKVPSIFLYEKTKKLDEVDTVRAYYLPRSKVLVNVEW